MAVSRTEFLIKTLMFCLLLFALTSIANGLALIAKGDMESYDPDIGDRHGSGEKELNTTETEYNVITGIGEGILQVLTGYQLPMPFPIIIFIWNTIIISTIIYCVAEIIRSWTPFVPGG